MSEKICVVAGVGPGTGAALSRRFAAGGYRVAMLARDAGRLAARAMARSLGPTGIHVAYVVIDAVIDVPWTRQAFASKPDEFFARPAGIAETVYHVAHQDRSAWTFEVDLRPFGEKW